MVYLPERFKHPAVEREAGRWIRAHPREVLDHPEALKFILGERLDRSMQRDVKVCASVVFLLRTLKLCNSMYYYLVPYLL